MDGVEMATKTRSKLKSLLSQPDNRVCADCGAPDPKWAYVPLTSPFHVLFSCVKMKKKNLEQ